MIKFFSSPPCRPSLTPFVTPRMPPRRVAATLRMPSHCAQPSRSHRPIVAGAPSRWGGTPFLPAPSSSLPSHRCCPAVDVDHGGAGRRGQEGAGRRGIRGCGITCGAASRLFLPLSRPDLAAIGQIRSRRAGPGCPPTRSNRGEARSSLLRLDMAGSS